MRVDTYGLPADNWHHFLRLRDLRQILAEVPLEGVTRVLELGAGDGVQSSALREHFAEVTPIDIAPSGDVDGLIVADASSLPFVDSYFDLVFSSNVLEHIEDLDACMAEMKRVLAPGGIMIHSMPTGTWKLIQVANRPIASIVKVMRRLVPGLSRDAGRAHLGSHASVSAAGPPGRSVLQKIVGQFIPSIHGVSGNHAKEFIRFRPRWWKRKFRNAGLECYRSSPLFLHSPYDMLPYRFIGLRDRISRTGIASVQVYWLRPIQRC
ncbi:MAG: class I SAM-dependent methyltransferase [Chloroflexi bacterium]|nr:class I SAM-dependent methyltransferase [Chloroflexota bacterium]